MNTRASTRLTIPAPAGVGQGDLLVGCVSLNGGTIAQSGGAGGMDSADGGDQPGEPEGVRLARDAAAAATLAT
jgi:hypothetical protein